MTIRVRILPGEPPALPQCVLDESWPSRLELKQGIRDRVTSLLIGTGWVHRDDAPWIQLCMDEAVTNAMLHGNEGDPRLMVRVAIHALPESWVILVADQGGGFTADAVPDQEDPSSLLLEHGRGIRMMQEWLDDLVYYRGGSLALLSRRRADAG
jgi:serine/threonine-protein kinase RsbW